MLVREVKFSKFFKYFHYNLFVDSGGPLMNDNAQNNDRVVLLGIVSFGPRSCGLANFPGKIFLLILTKFSLLIF